MTELSRAILDTSVVIDINEVDRAHLPGEIAISAVTLAELTAGVGYATDPVERIGRQRALQAAEATFDVLPFDAESARAYGQVDLLVRLAGRKPRGRTADLFIAATAVANDLPVLTRNPKDFVGLESLVQIISI
jgi:predicted nucleic acid-binding protein